MKRVTQDFGNELHYLTLLGYKNKGKGIKRGT